MLPDLSGLRLSTRDSMVVGAGEKRQRDKDQTYQRMQSYYVCEQDRAVGPPVLHVVRGWFAGQNRLVFQVMQQAADMGYVLDVNDFSCLHKHVRVQFETALDWYTSFAPALSDFATSVRGDGDTEELRSQIPTDMLRWLRETRNDPDGRKFAADFAERFDGAARGEYPEIVNGQLSRLAKHMVPAEPDSFVVFAGPHMVEDSPVKRLCLYVHSETEISAKQLLDRHGPRKSSNRAVSLGYEGSVREMIVPPSAQGTQRSNLIDKYLKEANGGVWGWPLRDAEGSSSDAPVDPAQLAPPSIRPHLLLDHQSIEECPPLPALTQDQRATVAAIKSSMKNDSCYVHKSVLGGSSVAAGAGLTASRLAQHSLDDLAIVLNRGVEEHRRLRDALRGAMDQRGATMEQLLAPNQSDARAGKVLDGRLDTMLGLTSKNNAELHAFATNVLLRGPRKATSAAWTRFTGADTGFAWPPDPEQGGDKRLRDPAEARGELLDRPVPASALGPDGKFDVRLTRLMHKGGDLQEPRDQWWLVCNVSGQKSAALLRKQMFDAGEIPHPHIGAWVSTQMPWSPPLCTPVGNWQNVYLVLTLGMFDSHYNPRQNFLRAALHPVIHAAWKAVSRQPFTKILYAPERSNVRFLPNGGQKLNWHVDASAIAPVCLDDLPEEPAADPADPPEPAGSFLADAAPRGSGAENDPITLDTPYLGL